MTRLRYDPLTQILHWVIALAVITSYVIAVVREDMPKGDFRNWLLIVHMSLGMIVFALSFIRLGWRAITPAPAPVAVSPDWARLGARAAHGLLYLALFALPVIGLISAWAKGRTVGFFNFAVLPSPIALNKPLGNLLEDAHGLAGHIMMLVAGGHALAAIGHQFWLKDGTLGRMLPFLPARPVAAPPVGE